MNSERDHAIFFVGCIAPLTLLWPRPEPRLITALTSSFGPICEIWRPTSCWPAPTSYVAEMGHDLSTMVFLFRNKCTLSHLAHRKQLTIQTEDRFTFLKRRRFNLNPGIVNSRGMYLASHKDGPHRTYLGQNAWVERQLERKGSALVPLSNTFPEYSHALRLRRFNHLLEQLTSLPPSGLSRNNYAFRISRSVTRGVVSTHRRIYS